MATNPYLERIDAINVLLLTNKVDPQRHNHHAYNGLHAVEQVRAQSNDNPYHLIFMDCNMPIMDGYQATAKIRQFYADQDLPQPLIVALTGHEEKEFKKNGEAIGMDMYLRKPANH